MEQNIPEYFDSVEIKGFTVKAECDQDGGFDCPRDWDNAFTILTAESRNRNIDDALDIDGDPRVEEAALVFPVYKYEHGNVSYSSGAFTCPWDSGQVGFAILTAEEFESEFGNDAEKAKRCLDGELATYTAWCNGEICTITVEDEDGEIIDSISGIYEDERGYAWAVQEYSIPEIEGEIKKREAEAVERRFWAERDVVTA